MFNVIFSIAVLIGLYGVGALPVSSISVGGLSAVRNVDDWLKTVEDNQFFPTDPEELRKLRALRQAVVDNGCEINMCFALDGSGSIDTDEYQDQKDFVDFIVAITLTANPGNYAGVQYHNHITPISFLTDDRFSFLSKLHASTRRGGSTNISAGLGFCIFQLLPRTEDANKVIILGDGFGNIGFDPEDVVGDFLDIGGQISAVAVGSSDTPQLEAITGSPDRVFTIEGFYALGEVILALVENVCNV